MATSVGVETKKITGGYTYTLDQAVSQDSSNVNVTLAVRLTNPDGSPKIYWSMFLQRYTNGVWVTIGTRTGYVSTSSKSDRTFTNVSNNTGKKTRVKTNLYWDSAHSDYIAAIPGPTWTR